MFSTLKKWFIGRPLKSGAEGEGGLLGTFFYCLWSRASYPSLDDRISRSHLVVHSNWDCGPGSSS